MTIEEKREYCTRYIEGFARLRYRWGGDDPIKGFDCSGLAIEYLKSAGILPERGDWTANQLLRLLAERGCLVSKPARGALVFWADKPKLPCIATHVEICVSDELSLGAHGSSKVQTEADAATHNAYIMVRPIWREDSRWMIFVDPYRGS